VEHPAQGVSCTQLIYYDHIREKCSLKVVAMEEISVPEDLYAKRLANKDNVKKWHAQARAEKSIKALEKNGFIALWVEDRNIAREEILKLIPESATVGVGGSMTIRETGVLQVLTQKGHTIYDHWVPGLSQEEILNIRLAQLTSDVFLTSTNALTLDGELVNTDGIGNRIGAMTFGPKKVIVVAGVNKIVADVHAAIRRIKEIAAAPAMKESNIPIPCVQTGICIDCDSPMRLCRATLILERRPMLTDMTVMIVGEELGF